jgi:hypothetical protein
VAESDVKPLLPYAGGLCAAGSDSNGDGRAGAQLERVGSDLNLELWRELWRSHGRAGSGSGAQLGAGSLYAGRLERGQSDKRNFRRLTSPAAGTVPGRIQNAGAGAWRLELERDGQEGPGNTGLGDCAHCADSDSDGRQGRSENLVTRGGRNVG